MALFSQGHSLDEDVPLVDNQACGHTVDVLHVEKLLDDEQIPLGEALLLDMT